jgi:hypothetical protein
MAQCHEPLLENVRRVRSTPADDTPDHTVGRSAAPDPGGHADSRQFAEEVPGGQHGEDPGAALRVADLWREMTMAPLHSDAALSSCGR